MSKQSPQQLHEVRPSEHFHCTRCGISRLARLTGIEAAGGRTFELLPCVCRIKEPVLT